MFFCLFFFPSFQDNVRERSDRGSRCLRGLVRRVRFRGLGNVQDYQRKSSFYPVVAEAKQLFVTVENFRVTELPTHDPEICAAIFFHVDSNRESSSDKNRLASCVVSRQQAFTRVVDILNLRPKRV